MKIIADKQARQYELTFLLPSELTSAEVKKIHETVAELIAKHKGEIKDQQDWGQKDLVYTIKMSGKRYNQAIYFHWLLDFMPSAVTGFEQELKLKPGILRYLLVIARVTAPDAPDIIVRTQDENERNERVGNN